MNIFAAITGLIMAFVSMQIVSFSIEGYGGLAATHLTSGIDEEETTIPVSTTSGFLSTDYIFIDNEIVCYVGIDDTNFLTASRGCHNSEVDAHDSGSRVFNETTGVINQMIGFNIAETMSTSGPIRVIFSVPGALMHAIPKLVAWDYSYLEGDLFGFPLVYLKYMLLYPISGGFIIAFVILMISVFMGIARVVT